MKIFVTGATGFIGSVVVRELLDAGHGVLGLTRSDQGAAALRAAGAEAHRGDLDDLDSLRAGAAASDGVIHLAFNHDFSKFVENCEADRRVIETIGGVLAGSDRKLVVTSGTGMGQGTAGVLRTENDPPVSSKVIARAASEEAVEAVGKLGVPTVVVRLPQVHDTAKQGLVTYLIQTARAKGVAAYAGDGANRWSAAHIRDVGRLYKLAFEKGEAGERFNAVAEEGLSLREIAETTGRGLKVPVKSVTGEEAAAYFGWLTHFASLDLAASSAQTRERLGWHPTGPGLIADLDAMLLAD